MGGLRRYTEIIGEFEYHPVNLLEHALPMLLIGAQEVLGTVGAVGGRTRLTQALRVAGTFSPWASPRRCWSRCHGHLSSRPTALRGGRG